jgi:hypothetical protein
MKSKCSGIAGAGLPAFMALGLKAPPRRKPAPARPAFFAEREESPCNYPKKAVCLWEIIF